MGWVVETILRNRERLRIEQDIESDEFNDLIVIEGKIEELYNEGFLSDVDMVIINHVADGVPIADLEEVIGKGRLTISKSFTQICERLSYFLGGYFTDEGFLDNMKETYRLSDTNLDTLRAHINSRFKHKLMRTSK